MHNHCVRQIKMPLEDWEALLQLAHEMYAVDHDGRHALRISVPALFRAIARREVLLSRPRTKAVEQIERVDEAIAKNERRAKQEATQGQYTQLSLEAA